MLGDRNGLGLRQLLLAFSLVLGLGMQPFVLGGPLRRSARDSTTIRILFTGDILLSRNVRREIETTGRSPWDSLSAFFHTADAVLGNFEGAVGRATDCLPGPADLCFAVPESLLSVLSGSGFTGFSLANNHSHDLGATGLERTAAALRTRGFLAATSEGSPWFRSIRGRRFAILALDLVPGRDGLSDTVPSPAIARALRTARAFSDYVIVFAHWGRELRDWPDPSQTAAARWMARRGADLIIGCHSHVIQSPDSQVGIPVFYSLGNHVFDQKYPESKRGLIADCKFNAEGVHCGQVFTHAIPGSFNPILAGRSGFPSSTHPVPDRPRQSASTLGSPADSIGLFLENAPDGSGSRFTVTMPGDRAWRGPFRHRLAAQCFRDSAGSPLLFSLESHFSPLDGTVSIRPYVYALGPAGLYAKWRGSGLAWPLLDAGFAEGDEHTLCALHRGDSFVAPDPANAATRIAAYQWNGFGFSLTKDAEAGARCADFFL